MAKTQKIRKSVSLTDSDVQTFLEGKENQYTKRKTESCVFSGFGNGISYGRERKPGRFATDQFGRLTERFILSVRTKAVNENLVN